MVPGLESGLASRPAGEKGRERTFQKKKKNCPQGLADKRTTYE